MKNVAVTRIYEPAAKVDGFRMPVDRLRPRGISKETAKLDFWPSNIGTTTALRQWFNHEPARWEEFRRRDHAELKKKATLLATIIERAKGRPVTRLYCAKNERYNQAVALRRFLGSRQTP